MVKVPRQANGLRVFGPRGDATEGWATPRGLRRSRRRRWSSPRSGSGQVPTHNGLTAVDDSGCSESLPFLDRGAAKQHGGSLAMNANGSALFVLVPCNDAAHDGPSQYFR